MTKSQELQAELKHVQQLLEAIEEAWTEGTTDKHGDRLVPEHWADRISMLLEC